MHSQRGLLNYVVGGRLKKLPAVDSAPDNPRRLQKIELTPHRECRDGPAAPQAAPGALLVKSSRYAQARTKTSAVTAAVCIGGAISTSLHNIASLSAV